MIVGPLAKFEARCRQRGYTLDEVRACIVSQEGDSVTVDETHPAYPRHARPDMQPTALPHKPAGGPGTELKRILSDWLGITAKPNCSCNARSIQMDVWGPDGCEQRIKEIVSWLEQEAKSRRLPFVRFAAEQAVRLAIRRARKAAAR